MEASIIITLNRPKSPNYLIPCSSDPLQPVPLIPRFPLLSLSPVFCILSFSCLRVFVANVRALQLSNALYKSPLFMQNKPNVKIGKMTISPAKTRPYLNEQQTTNNERCSKQTQTNPNKPKQTQFPQGPPASSVRHLSSVVRLLSSPAPPPVSSLELDRNAHCRIIASNVVTTTEDTGDYGYESA